MTVALDVGTMNLVSARKSQDGKIIFRKERDIFLELPSESNDAKAFLNMAGTKLVTFEGKNYVVGEEAINFASFLNEEFKRPLKAGLINPQEEETAIKMLDIIIDGVLGKPEKENETCIFCIPAEPIDEKRNVVYHQKTLEYIIKRHGFNPKPINEATAIIYSELQNNHLSGIGISFGAGMCLRGDTLIPLLNGEKKTIKELVDLGIDNKFWVYSCKEDGQIVPGLATNARKIGTKEIIRIWLDNNKFLDCTRDHKIMLRDGTYKEAQFLKENDSLMPLYLFDHKIDGRKGYQQVVNNKTEKKNHVHRLIYKSFNNCDLKKDEIIHHIDCNPSNNSPMNLQKTNRSEHQQIHKNLARYVLQNVKGKKYEEIFGEEFAKETKARRSQSHKNNPNNSGRWQKGKTAHNKGKTNIEKYGLERAKEISSKIAKTTSLNNTGRILVPRETRACICGCNTEFECKINSKKRFISGHNGKLIKHTITEDQKIRTSNTLKQKYKNGELKLVGIAKQKHDARVERELQYHNHKVKGIEFLDIREDVYDISVEKYHNFAIDSGIFVHNCNLATLYKGFPVMSFSLSRSGDWVDEQVKQATGKTAAEITVIKETELDLTQEGETRIHRYLRGYYEELIDYLIRNIIKKFEQVKSIPPILNAKNKSAEALPIVVAGGTSCPKGFAELLRDRIEKSQFPFKISKIIVASDPLYTVARGLLTYGLIQK